MPEINFSGRLIGPDHPPLVIAEMGINHGGSLKTACEMVDAAASAGVEVLKHQTHVIDDVNGGPRKLPEAALEGVTLPQLPFSKMWVKTLYHIPGLKGR